MRLMIIRSNLYSIVVIGNQNSCQAQNGYDSNGKKTGKWVFKGKDHPRSGYATYDTKVEEGNFIQGRKEGMWIKYHKRRKDHEAKRTLRK